MGKMKFLGMPIFISDGTFLYNYLHDWWLSSPCLNLKEKGFITGEWHKG